MRVLVSVGCLCVCGDDAAVDDVHMSMLLQLMYTCQSCPLQVHAAPTGDAADVLLLRAKQVWGLVCA